MFKLQIVFFLTVVAVARAGILPAAAPLAVPQPVLSRYVEEYDPHPRYNFAYEVQDALTGDSKNQVEARDGDVVQGQYSLIDADGYKRIVDYSADSVNGFNALVHREPFGLKTVAVAPATVKSAALASYAAPAPALIKSSPTLSHNVGSALVRSTPLANYNYGGYNAYSGYAAPTIIRSTSPAQLASSTIVKTAYSSPIASYHY